MQNQQAASTRRILVDLSFAALSAGAIGLSVGGAALVFTWLMSALGG